MFTNAGNVIQKENTMFMNTKWYHLAMLITIIVLLQSCTEMAFIGGSATIAVSQNPYAKTYSGVDVITIMSTEKDIKTHVYDRLTESTPRNPPAGSGSSPEKDHSRFSPPWGYPSSGCVSERERDERQ